MPDSQRTDLVVGTQATIEEQATGSGKWCRRDMSDAANLSFSLCPIMRDGATRAAWYLWSLQVMDTRGKHLGYFLEGVVCSERAMGFLFWELPNVRIFTLCMVLVWGRRHDLCRSTTKPIMVFWPLRRFLIDIMYGVQLFVRSTVYHVL